MIELPKIKYVVIKIEDINNFLKAEELVTLVILVDKILNNRKAIGKKDNEYLVINTDEPYAEKVVDILKEHGHWG